MPEGPLGAPRPGIKCRQTVVVKLSQSYHFTEHEKAEIEARINEAEVGDKQITAVKCDVIQRNSSNTHPSSFLQVITEEQHLTEDAVGYITDTVDTVLNESHVDRTPPKSASWILKAK